MIRARAKKIEILARYLGGNPEHREPATDAELDQAIDTYLSEDELVAEGIADCPECGRPFSPIFDHTGCAREALARLFRRMLDEYIHGCGERVRAILESD